MTGYYDMPYPLRAACCLLILCLSLGLIYLAQDILIPIGMAVLFSILLRPVTFFLKNKLRFPHVIACITSVVIMIVIVIGIFTFISFQIAEIANDWNTIKSNLQIHWNNLQNFVYESFHLTKREQEKLIDDATKNGTSSTTDIAGTTLLTLSDTVMNMVLTVVYTFLFLLYRTHFLKFLSKLVPIEHQRTLEGILFRIKSSVQSYIIGLVIEMVVVSVLTTIGFMLIGLEYAILLGCITGLLNLIPYLGILIAGVLAALVGITTNTDFSIIFGVIIVNIVVQIIDNNLLVPMIVSSKVELNAFVSIVCIIIGGTLAGVSGMFLAIPMFAIMKVIFDQIPPLEPWGYFLGDDLPKTYQWKRIHLPFYHYKGDGTSINPPAPINPIVPVTENPVTDEKKDINNGEV